MRFLILNGVNLNMLGIREPEIYGKQTYDDLCRFIKVCCQEENIDYDILQTNMEGQLVNYIQQAYQKYDGIIINAGAYTHYSIAILDALKAVAIPYVEVHLSDICDREEFRKNSITGLASVKIVKGLGFDSYKVGIKTLKDYLLEK
ncbi:MAG: 3-dehydroquinate dehydratase [Bacilli bacterium]|nr:3-dehydroquinate dehydratase [Bacilli bacterium]